MALAGPPFRPCATVPLSLPFGGADRATFETRGRRWTPLFDARRMGSVGLLMRSAAPLQCCRGAAREGAAVMRMQVCAPARSNDGVPVGHWTAHNFFLSLQRRKR